GELLEMHATRLRQQSTPQGLLEDLSALVEEAITYIGHNDYEGALALYALMFDERLLERSSALVPTFDEMIDAAMPSLESLLTEASSNTMFDISSTTLVPLLLSQVRQQWLERLFALWLRRLDAHKIEEDLPEIMLDVA